MKRLVFKFILKALAHVHTWRVYALVNIDRGPLAPSNWNSRMQAKIKGIRSTSDHLFSDVIDDDASKTLIIPTVNARHFFVLVVEFNVKYPELFVRFKYYDSLQPSSRGGTGIMKGSPAWLIVCEVWAFSFNFVLHNKNKFNNITPPTDDDLLNHMIGFHQCPVQYNDIDCGLILYCSCLSSAWWQARDRRYLQLQPLCLASIKIGCPFKPWQWWYEQTSQVVRDCFPQLKGTSILSSDGIEVVANVPVASKPSLLRIQRLMMMWYF